MAVKAFSLVKTKGMFMAAIFLSFRRKWFIRKETEMAREYDRKALADEMLQK